MLPILGRRARPRNSRPTDFELDELRAKVAHELFTPLTSVVGHLEYVCEGDAGPLSDEQRSILEIAAHNSRRLSGIVRDLLEMTTVDPAMIIGYLARQERSPVTRAAGQPQTT
jgi:signal transduction histidine kinase